MAKDEKTYEALELRALGAHLTAAFDTQLDQQSATLGRDFADKHRRLLATTASLRETLLELRERGWSTHAGLWNIGLHINLAAHDLSVLVWQLCTGRDIWARKLAARHVALMAFEITDDLTQLLGGSIREALTTLGVLPRHEHDLRSARAPLDAFRQAHARQLSSIRNLAAAHRDADGLQLLSIIESLDIQETISLGLKLGQIVNRIGQMLQSVLTDTSGIAPPELARSDSTN